MVSWLSPLVIMNKVAMKILYMSLIFFWYIFVKPFISSFHYVRFIFKSISHYCACYGFHSKFQSQITLRPPFLLLLQDCQSFIYILESDFQFLSKEPAEF